MKSALTTTQVAKVQAAIKALRAAQPAVDYYVSEANGDGTFHATHQKAVETLMELCGKTIAGYEDLLVRK